MHGVAIDPFGADAFAPSPLDGVIDAQHDGSARHEVPDEEPEQDAAGSAGVPHRTIHDAMKVDEVPIPSVAHDAQYARDRASARSQDGADEQHLGVVPGATLAEERGKG